MRFSNILAVATIPSLAVAAPFSFPLKNGFPNANISALGQVLKLAGGTAFEAQLPTKLKPAGIQALQLIAVQELFETAFFTQLLNNLTDGVDGYVVDNKDYIVDVITAVQNQEQIHSLGANGILASAGQGMIQPCQYLFPVTDYKSAIALAATFTEVDLGALPQAQAVFAADGDQESGLVAVIGTILAQEGQQDGWYRTQQGKLPSSAPILTSTPAQFAFSAVSQFIVPGSCPSSNQIGISTLPALTIETSPTNSKSIQLFSVQGALPPGASVTYVSGARTPLTVPVTGVTTDSTGRTLFFAEFPGDVGFARGLSYASVVAGNGSNFKTVSHVGEATLFGPAVVQLN